MRFETWPIEKIVVVERLRGVDVGDVDYLAALIDASGWVQPLEVHRDGTLHHGVRRLLACKKLGRTHVPVMVVEEDEDGSATDRS